MLGASYGIELPETVLTKQRNCEQTYQRMHQVLACQWSLWGWNQDHAQSIQHPGPKRSNPHNLVQVGSGLILKPCP